MRNLEALKNEGKETITPEKRPTSIIEDDDDDDRLDSVEKKSPMSYPRSSSSGPSPKRARVSGLMFTVREVLLKDLFGNDILAGMESGELSAKYRKKMVQILVSHMIQVHGDRPLADIKLQLARAIISEFPRLKDSTGEGYESFYTPGFKDHPASGYLEIRLRNVRRTLGLSSPKSATKKAAAVESSIQIENTLTESDSSTMVAWLKANRQPEAKVREYMLKTAPKRLAELREAEDLGPILLEYPRLLDTPGMIEQDFNVVFSSKANLLYEKWEKKTGKVMEWASLQGNSWRKHLNLPENLAGEETALAALHVLPCVLPTGVAFSGGSVGKRIKYSKADSAQAFIDCQPVGTNIPQYLENLEKDGSRKQPFVLVLGDRLAPSQNFLIVERIAVPQGSTLAAVDACFKAFYILNFEYPAACKAVWHFLQYGCYGIGDSRNMTPSVRSLITSFNS